MNHGVWVLELASAPVPDWTRSSTRPEGVSDCSSSRKGEAGPNAVNGVAAVEAAMGGALRGREFGRRQGAHLAGLGHGCSSWRRRAAIVANTSPVLAQGQMSSCSEVPSRPAVSVEPGRSASARRPAVVRRSQPERSVGLEDVALEVVADLDHAELERRDEVLLREEHCLELAMNRALRPRGR